MADTNNVNPDLAKERQNATFDSEQLTYFLYGGPEKTKRKRYLQNLVIQDLQKLGMKQYVTLNREEQFEQAHRKYVYMADVQKRLGITSRDGADSNYISEAVHPAEAHPYLIHHVFANTVSMMASEQQKTKWMPLIKNYRVIGTYGQTELGHGTFLRGLETTATYDPASQEFVLHCPTISSMKYWPGGLGKTANYCVVMAQLISKGHNYGMHAFLVQLRDLDTHQVLPGITVGDIGNKFGMNTIDNGFLKMDSIRIPRENMLMRHSQVMPDGSYVKPKSSQLMYGGMTSLRSSIVGMSARKLSMAITIAIRYSAVRRQSEIEPGAGEVQVLDFQTQQFRLFPLLAGAYAGTIVSRAMDTYYQTASANIAKGKLDELPLLHALSAGLKAYVSWLTADGVEVCRLACGGHGYSQASGLPKLYVSASPDCTYEGENHVLMLQTARYLMKCCRMLASGESVPELMNFLRSPSSGRSKLNAQINYSGLMEAYKHRAARMIREVAQHLQTSMDKGLSAAHAWNSHAVQLLAAAKAFMQLYLVQTFVESIHQMRGQVRRVMTGLWQLFALHGILTSLGDFLMDGYLSSEQVSMLENARLDLLKTLRPNAVSLVDAFDFPDAVLDSALGRWDGQVYQALFDYSQRSSLNKTEVLDAYYKYQRPFMESKWDSTANIAKSRL